MGVTCTEVSTGVWDLSLSITDTGYPVVTIIVNDLPGGISPAIRDLLVTINNPGGSGPTVALDLMGPFGDEDNLASLGTLTFATTTGGQLILREVYVGGDVGYIDTHAIGSLVIEGGSHRGHRYPSH